MVSWDYAGIREELNMEQTELCELCNTPVYEYLCSAKPLYRYKVCPSCAYTLLLPEFALTPTEERGRYLLHTNTEDNSGYLQYLAKFFELGIMPFISSGASLLDFGSGPNPQLAKLLKERNYKVSIYDPFFADDKEVFGFKYDAVLLHEVIEHLENPLEELQKLARLVLRGGSLIIRTQLRPQDDRAFDSWWYRKDTTHRSFFTADTFAAMARHLDLNLNIAAPDILLMTMH